METHVKRNLLVPTLRVGTQVPTLRVEDLISRPTLVPTLRVGTQVPTLRVEDLIPRPTLVPTLRVGTQVPTLRVEDLISRLLVPTLRVGTQVPTLRVEELMMSRSRYRVHEPDFAYFFTCTTVGWLPVFTRPECVSIVFDSWQFLQNNGRLKLYGYVILENHLHFVASGNELARTVGDFKSFTARQIIDLLEKRGERTLLKQLQFEKDRHKIDRTYQLWQEGSHPKQVIDDEMMDQKLNYIHNNPVKRGYVDDPVHWRYSIARNYAGMEAMVPVTTDWLWGNGSESVRVDDAERRDVRSHAERGNEGVGI